MRSQNYLLLALIIGSLHGLVYVFLVPPWQHYDEPNHFEYVWLVANHGGIPEPGESEPEMRQELQDSMWEHNFFVNIGPPPAPNAQGAWIGPASQLDNQPLYYLVASIPLRLLGDVPITNQLYGARFVSLLFLLVSIAAGWGTAVEIIPKGHWLRFALPLSLALLPSFVDSMTAVNNDSAAVGFASLTIWASVRLVKREFNWITLLGGLIASFGCLYSKESAYVCLPAFLLGVVFSVFGARNRRYVLIALTVVVVVFLLIVLVPGDASLWYRSTSQWSFTSAPSQKAVHGDRVFVIQNEYEVTPRWLVPIFQPIPLTDGGFAGKRTYTIAGWLWGETTQQGRTALLGDGRTIHAQTLDIDTNPQFFAFTVRLDGYRMWVSLAPTPRPAPGAYFYDGLVLVEGEWPFDTPPVFDDATGRTGVWGGEPFENLIRNPSAEQIGLRLRPTFDNLGAAILPDSVRPSLLLTYYSDWRGAGWYYQATAGTLLRTFWAKFGWGHVPLPGNKPYRFLGWVTLAGIAGALVAILRSMDRLERFSWAAMVVLGTTLAIAWLGTFSRGAIYLGIPRLYIPVARYAYPAIIPSLLVLTTGWFTFLNFVAKRIPQKRFSDYLPHMTFLFFFVTLDVVSVFALVGYYSA